MQLQKNSFENYYKANKINQHFNVAINGRTLNYINIETKNPQQIERFYTTSITFYFATYVV